MTRIGHRHVITFMLISLALVNLSHSQDVGVSLQERLSSLAEVAKSPGYAAIKIGSDQESERLYGGVREFGKTPPITSGTIQVHGSLSALLVSMAVMKAVEQGHFSLDTPVNDIIPFQVVHPNGRDIPITVRHLLSHKGGINDETGAMYRSYLFTRDINYNHESLASDEKKMLRRANLSDRYSLQALLQKSLASKGEFYTKNIFTNNLPGDSEEYSMLGLALLALAVESGTGYFYDQYVEEFIFGSLGINSATWTVPPTDADATSPHMGSSMDVIPDYNQNLYPNAGFRASISDVEILLRAVLSGLSGKDNVISSASWQAIFGGLVPKFQNLTITEMNPAPVEALSSYTMSGYHVIGAQNYGSTSVLLIEPQRGEVVYFTSNTCFAHLNRGGFFLSEIMRLLVETTD